MAYVLHIKAYQVCKEKDLVPEMVFLLGKMGNNKQALMLIIEKIGDVYRVMHFPIEVLRPCLITVLPGDRFCEATKRQ